jgi:hypothetical protein
MLKRLALITIYFSCFFQMQGQSYLSFRKEASIPMDLYWSKGFNLIEDNRLELAKELIEPLLFKSQDECISLDEDFASLKSLLETKDKTQIQKAFSKVVITSLLVEIKRIHLIEGVFERKKFIRDLFKEMIAIQKYAKQYNFELYKELMICFRRLNQLSNDAGAIESYVQSLNIWTLNEIKC